MICYLRNGTAYEGGVVFYLSGELNHVSAYRIPRIKKPEANAEMIRCRKIVNLFWQLLKSDSEGRVVM